MGQFEQLIRKCFPYEPWPHQVEGIKNLFYRLQDVQSCVLCSPTGGGKGLMQTAMLRMFKERGKKAIIYNQFNTLTHQAYRRFESDGISVAARAACLHKQTDLNADFQVASLKTDIARVLNREIWEPHDADYVIVDEAHLSCSEKAVELFQRYLAKGAKLIGITGTPVGLSGLYKDVVVAGTNSELRDCGAHVPADVYSIHEMDTQHIRPVKTGEFTDGDIRRHCWNQQIVGYIYSDYRQLNPDGRPALAAAPGVAQSIWLSERFLEKGHRVAHIDAKCVVINGERYSNDTEGKVREQVLDDFRKGCFDILCNCEVIQQGVDLPNLHHLILARPYGSLANCLQVYGRVIRKSPETPDRVIVQDHGGNYWRHGHPDEDRDWEKLFHQTPLEIAEERKERLQEDEKLEPIVCPECGATRTSGEACYKCGKKSNNRQRRIVEKDGTLRLVERGFQKPAVKPRKSVEQERWDRIFYASRNSRSPRASNFNQAKARYEREYKEKLPRNLSNLPIQASDWRRKIRDLRREELT